jgi:ABC-type multidrug transport system ATPase subunit
LYDPIEMSDVGVPSSRESLQSRSPNADSPIAASFVEEGFTLACEGICLESRRLRLRRKDAVLSNFSAVISGGVHAIVSTDTFVSRKALEVIAGIEKGTSAGTVMANAIPVASSAFRQHVGYISSTDVCLLDATGRSNLLFSLRMRLDTVHEDRIIKEAADVCGLAEQLDARVEDMSTAERLRLAVAMELVLDPHVVLLENPLRYLCVSDHYEFAAMLRRLSKNAVRTVVLTCASLPWPIYDVLDGIVLLAPLHGKLLYSGPKGECERFLANEVLPEGVEARGDAIVDLLLQWDDDGEIGHVVNTFYHSDTASRLSESLKRHKEFVVSNRFAVIRKDVAPCPPTALAQNLQLFGYSMRRALMRHDFIFSWVGLFATFFLLAALSANQQHDQNGMQNKRGIIFSLLSCAVHVNIMFVDSEVSEYHSFVHMRNNRYFGVPQYFFVTMIRLLFPRLLFSVIGVAFTAYIFSSAVPLASLMGLTSFAHALLVLLMTFWWPVANDLTLANLVYYAYCVMFCGFLMSVKSFPQLFSHLSLLRYGYGGAIAFELQGNQYSCDATVIGNITLSASYCYTGNQYLALEGFDGDSWGQSAVTLVILSLVLLVLLLVSMKVAWATHA